MRFCQRVSLLSTLLFLLLGSSSSSFAISVAVFGGGSTAPFLNSTFGPGTATVVSDAQIATPGFLSAFDVFYFTRQLGNGVALSSGAAAQVSNYVGGTGNVVLFPGDWQDMLPGGGDPIDGNVEQLTANAVAFAALSHHGFVSEYNGSAAAVSANADGLLPLNLIPGTAANLGPFSSAVGAVSLTPSGIGNPVVAGVSFPFLPAESVTYRTVITGVPTDYIVATFQDGAPAIIVYQGQAVPETLPAAAFAAVCCLIAGIRRFQKSQTTK